MNKKKVILIFSVVLVVFLIMLIIVIGVSDECLEVETKQKQPVSLLLENDKLIVDIDNCCDKCSDVKNDNKKCDNDNRDLKEKNIKLEKLAEGLLKYNPKSVKEFSYYDFGENFIYKREEFFILDMFTPEKLQEESYECNQDKDVEYFKKLFSTYLKTDKGVKYSFKYGKSSQGRDSWDIIVIPNKIFKSEKNFYDDLALCFAGGDRYPFKLNDNYLMFSSSCGTGFNDGSELPIGCSLVSDIIGGTIMLK